MGPEPPSTRLVHLLVPSDGLDTVTGVLDEEGVDYVVTEERSRDGAEGVEFPIPVGAVESILDTLRSVQADFTGLGLLGGARGVDVVVSRPADRGYPDLTADIGRTLEERTGTDVAVTAEFAEQTEFRSGG